MKNYWLEKFRIGRKVKYIGEDIDLFGKVGHIRTKYDDDTFGVEFEFANFGFATKHKFIVAKIELELV